MSARTFLTRAGARVIAGAAAVGALASLAGAQAASTSAAAAAPAMTPGLHRFSVTTRAGGISFERAASLNRSFLLGLDTDYGFSRFFELGTTVNVSRPNTHAEDFVTSLTFGVPGSGDTTSFYAVGQSVNIIQGALTGTARTEVGRVAPYLRAGIGLYGAFLDPQTNAKSRRFGGRSTEFGGGATFRISNRAGVQLDVRDLMLANYRAAQFDASDARNRDVAFYNEFAHPPARKNTVNSVGYTLGFRYVPSFLNSTTSDPDDRVLNPNGAGDR